MAIDVGKHILIDLHGCNSELLKKVEYISEAMMTAARKSEATIVGRFFKQFDPWGVSGVIIIAESHITVHTWPEYGLASVDYFSCSEEPKIYKAIEHLKTALDAKWVEEIEVRRGSMKIQKTQQVNRVQETLNEMVV